jgi:serine/threonine protein kinase
MNASIYIFFFLFFFFLFILSFAGHPRIIHRDIKSSNILLDNDFEALVIFYLYMVLFILWPTKCTHAPKCLASVRTIDLIK